MLLAKLIFWYIAYCVCLGVKPWRFFQLNADYFNPEKKIFSKLEIDRVIPKKWRLTQTKIGVEPESFPVFVKPEWGQNSYGVRKAESKTQLEEIKKTLIGKNRDYIVQSAAFGKLEIDIFYIRDISDDKLLNLKIVQTNNCHDGALPINGVFNSNSSYNDITDNLSKQQKSQLCKLLVTIGKFRIARIGLKTDSIADLLSGAFKIIEINLFTPMPLNLLDRKIVKNEHQQFIKNSMYNLAKVTGAIPKTQVKKNIFFNKVLKHYQIKS